MYLHMQDGSRELSKFRILNGVVSKAFYYMWVTK
jgi:hypothetical protein